MHFNNTIARGAIAMIGLALMVHDASAALIAYDSAGDSAYNSGTAIGVDGGYGWGGPWSSPTFLYVQSSSLLGGAASGTGYINSPQTPEGRAWAIGSNSSYDPIRIQTKTASRPFSGPLTPGQTFSIDFDANPGAVAGIFLGDLGVGMGTSLNDVEVYQAQSLAGGTYVDFGPPVTDFGARADFTLLTDSTAQVTITSLAPGGESDSFILPYSTPMTGMLAENFPWGGGGFLYINNMSITPEPDGIALAIVILALISLARRGWPRRVHRSAIVSPSAR